MWNESFFSAPQLKRDPLDGANSHPRNAEMLIDFDRGIDPAIPLSARAAVDRGHAVVNRPVRVIMGLVMALGALFAFVLHRETLGYAIVISAPFVAWIWWSYAVPRWRHWALTRGASPDELQALAQREKLVWPRGHFFEKTEFPFKAS